MERGEIGSLAEGGSKKLIETNNQGDSSVNLSAIKQQGMKYS